MLIKGLFRADTLTIFNLTTERQMVQYIINNNDRFDSIYLFYPLSSGYYRPFFVDNKVG